MKIVEFVEKLNTDWIDLKKSNAELLMKQGQFEDNVKALMKHLDLVSEESKDTQLNVVEIMGAVLKNHYKETDKT